jgi:hypothetical protein
MTEMIEDKSEILRKLIEWSLAAGRTYQSAQTGMIHFYYGNPHCPIHQTIPIYENALFALSLLRTRQIENIKEAQNLLTRLLVFQNLDSSPSHGNFPVYLHEFPFCRDFSMAIQLLAPFYYILVGFRHVLGNELRTGFEKCIENILQYGLKLHQARPFPYSIAVRFAAGLAAIGKLFDRTDWIQPGLQLLEDLGNLPSKDSWCHTGHIADILISAQMAPQEFNRSLWKPFWDYLSATWQPELGCYCGPSLYEKQDQYEPEVGLYDLYLGYMTGKLAGRTQKLKFVHLHAALIHSSALEFISSSFQVTQGLFLEEKWVCIKHMDTATLLLEKTHPLNEKRENVYTSFRMLWGDNRVTHSLVCQGGDAKKIKHTWNESKVELIYDLEEAYEGKMDLAREIRFYFDMYAGLNITVNGQRTNTFDLGETVTLLIGDNKEIKIDFELIEGEGDFMGHIAQANRPSQTNQIIDKKPQIFDWILFLRTLRRSNACKVKVSIKFI